ncbi:MAG: N-acetylmuramidase [Rhizobiales bacterium]|nr:N-acetylmuramidase [Hyphomicrobiales bacterium]
MKVSFTKALDRVLVYEGGYSNHPRDPGGPTNKGVIQRVYDGWRKSRGEAPRSVKHITAAELRAIYKRQYWDKVQGDRLPAGVDFVVFDGAVNSGPSQATKWLQRALRMSRVDGDLGEATVAAALSAPDHDVLIADILRRRLGMLQGLTTWPDFGKGWSSRLKSCRVIGQAWAAGSVGPQPAAVCEEGGNAKGLVADVALPPVSEESGVKATVGGSSVAATVQTAQTQLEPLVGTSNTVSTIYAALTIAAIVIAVGGVGYALWASRRRKRAERAWSGEAEGDLDALMNEVPA